MKIEKWCVPEPMIIRVIGEDKEVKETLVFDQIPF
jgi:hypothetical protein